jgi:hypothetical protein
MRSLHRSKETKQVLSIWRDMRRRCLESDRPQYKDYGGRGITVCDRWMHSFDNFLKDMAPRPDGALLDRMDNDGPYDPSNCKWSNRVESNSNRRNCIYVVLDGERVTLKEACRRRGLKYRPVHKRIMERGWEVERALSIPVGTGRTMRT